MVRRLVSAGVYRRCRRSCCLHLHSDRHEILSHPIRVTNLLFFMRVHLKVSCSIGRDVMSNDKVKEAVAAELSNCTGTWVEEIKKREVSDTTAGDPAEIRSRHLTNTIEIWLRNEQLPPCEEHRIIIEHVGEVQHWWPLAKATTTQMNPITAPVSFFPKEDRLRRTMIGFRSWY